MHHGEVGWDIAEGLLELRRRIAAHDIPSSKLDESLNVATWNIREFGRRPRLPASLHYIAEVLNQFDLIAVTELRDDLSDLRRVLEILGPYWRAVFSDYVTDPGGNRERIAYVYDSRMAVFTGLAAEADTKRRKTAGEYLPEKSWWRKPYMASFRAGNFDFMLITAHIRWGDSERGRIGPLKRLAEWVDDRRKDKYVAEKDIVLMGDFNIPDVEGPLFAAITGRGLRLPDALAGAHGSNLARNKRYDQILHYPTHARRFSDRGGALDFYRDDYEPLYPDARTRPASKRRFTYEMSDHLPLWIQVNTDFIDERLRRQAAARPDP